MSDLLNSASLVMIPSGYKEDTVYSQIPTDGSGDMTLTRASNGTRVNSAGLVEVCPWNLLEESETFTSGVWSNQGVSISVNNTTAPNGTLTAELITVSSTNAEHNVYGPSAGLAITPNQTYTFSYYVKKGTARYLCAWMFWTGIGSGPYATFDLNTGLLVANGATFGVYVGSSIEALNDGWYRISVSGYGNYSSVINALDVRTSGSLVPQIIWLGAGETVYIWGAQLNIGSTAKPYFPTTDRLNVPRLTYQNGGGGCPSLLLEKQSTNLVSYSQDFSNAFWNKTNQGGGSVAVVTANYAISPDGTQNATRFVCNLNGGTTASDRSWMLGTFSAPATSTISIWIKLNSAGTKTFVFSDSGGGTKTISGTDWQRIDSTLSGAGGEFRIGLIGGSSSDTLDCCIWGAQAEGSSYVTSYIPTTSSSATRVADACSKTGISSLIGASEGVLFTDFVCNGFQDYGTPLCANDGTVNNSIWLTTFGNGTLRGEVFGSGSVQASFSMSGAVVGQRYKMALAYKANDFAMYINGTQIGTDSSGSIPSSLSRVDYDYANPSAFALSLLQINQSALFPTRLTNAELASLTTI